MSFTLGLDLGKEHDYTALAIVESMPEQVLHLRQLDRIQGKPYPWIVRKVAALIRTPELAGAHLVVDATGVGAAPVDLFREAGVPLTAVTITGGASETQTKTGNVRLPKLDLVMALKVTFQNGLLKFNAAELTVGDAWVKELQAFQYRINERTAHMSFGNDSKLAPHDDLVLAVALACWRAKAGWIDPQWMPVVGYSDIEGPANPDEPDEDPNWGF